MERFIERRERKIITFGVVMTANCINPVYQHTSPYIIKTCPK